MNISLPDGMRRYVEERVREGPYSTASEFFRELIRKDREERKREAREWLAREVIPAIESLDRGEFYEDTPEFWQGIREEVQERLAQAKTAEADGA